MKSFCLPAYPRKILPFTSTSLLFGSCKTYNQRVRYTYTAEQFDNQINQVKSDAKRISI